MIKLIGSALVLAVGTRFGFYMAARYADRPKQLRHFVNALQILETEILYGATPLPDACSRIGTRLALPVGPFFVTLGDKLRDGRGITADVAWREALTEHREQMVLKEPDRDVLLAFGRTLGVSDREDQIKHIHLAIAHLSTEEANARDEQSRNEKMWKYLGALLGLTVVILLY
ncbi:MAG: stage III sporulation protein SpoIIIAB [Tumebacillaceae bacterium]